MKKSFLFLFTVLCVMSFFTACSDDDDSNKGWESLSKTYEGENALVVKLGESVLPLGNKSVVVNASSAEKATLTLNNVVPDGQSITMDVALKQINGIYTFAGENKTGDCLVALKGTFEKGKLSLVVDRKMDTAIAGTWKMKISTDEGGIVAANVFVKIETGNPQLDGMANVMAGPVIGQLLLKKVASVQVVLGENGLLGASWKSAESGKETDISVYTKALSIQYCVVDGKLMIAVDKAYVELLKLLNDKLVQYGLSVDAITSLLPDLGGYYAVPLDVLESGSDMVFYLSKSLIVPAVQLLSPILVPSIPEEYKELVTNVLAVLPNAKRLDVGLVFEK